MKGLAWGVLLGGVAVAAAVGWLFWSQNSLQQRQLLALERQAAGVERLTRALGVPESGQPADPASAVARLGTTLELAQNWFAARAKLVAGKRNVSADDLDAALHLSCHGDQQIRDSAVQILGKLGGAAAEARLLEMVEESNNALSQLYALNPAQAEKIVGDWLKSGVNERMQAAVNALQLGRGRISKEMVGVILEAMKGMGGDTYGRNLRQSLGYILQNIRDPRVCPVMLELLQSETEEYQVRNFLNILLANAGRRELPLVLKAMQQMKGLERNTDVGNNALQYFGRIRDPRGTPAVMGFLKSSNDYYQRQAMQALARIGDPLAAPALAELAARKPNYVQELLNLVQDSGYPGLNVVDGKLQVVGETEMAKLLAERDELIRRLEAEEGKAGESAP
ncbi:MAG: HEAT repeat domain-containing protein [Lentisphaeria bacterium]